MIKYFICLIPFFSFSQNIILKGKVIDHSTGHPIENVDIYFKDAPFGTISNFKGDFIIDNDKISKNDTLIFSHIGYDGYQIKVSDFLSLTNGIIPLSPGITELEEVDVNPTTVKRVLKKAIDNYQSNSINDELFLRGYIKIALKEDSKIFGLAYTDVSLKIPEIRKQHRKKIKVSLLGNAFKWRRKSCIPIDLDLFNIYEATDFIKVKEKLLFFTEHLKSFDKISVKRDKYGNYNIYRIFLYKKITNKKGASIVINLDRQSYAVLSIEIKGDRGVLGDEKKWKTVYNKEETVKRRPAFSTGKILFRPYKGKWVLKEFFGDLSVNYQILSKKGKYFFTNYNSVDIVISDFSKTKPPYFNRNKIDLYRDVFNQISGDSIINSKTPMEIFNLKERQFLEK